MASTILEEEFDENYEPTLEEIEEYASFLGMDVEKERHFLWIARESLKAPLPPNWKPCQTDDENIYYFNFVTGESIWDHPCDEYYRKLYESEKEKCQKEGIEAYIKAHPSIIDNMTKTDTQLSESNSKMSESKTMDKSASKTIELAPIKNTYLKSKAQVDDTKIITSAVSNKNNLLSISDLNLSIDDDDEHKKKSIDE
ncbi:hypothetical protein PIROE2DRAFT_6428, partial [Piromyces sp. E2]